MYIPTVDMSDASLLFCDVWSLAVVVNVEFGTEKHKCIAHSAQRAVRWWI